jgi:flagellar hook-associated protein 3 FlgL
LFTALLRLKNGLIDNDLKEIERAVGLLDDSMLDLNFARADLGARQQGLDVLKERLDGEEIELRSVLSQDYDVDIAEVISNLTGRQVAMEAAMRATAMIFQMTLLNFL